MPAERGLLTTDERERLDDGAPERLRERLGTRLAALERDATLLATHEPELFERLKRAVRTATETTTESQTLGELSFPHDDDRHKAAVYAARDYVRANGPADPSEVVDRLAPVYPLTYDISEIRTRPADGSLPDWWTEVVGPGLELLPDLEEVEGRWHHVGDE
jgi:hypothetical protein